MKNTLIDLNNHLFAQLERLGDESMSADSIELEINRARAISSVADRVINNAALVLQARKIADDLVPSKSTDKLLALDSVTAIGSDADA